MIAWKIALRNIFRSRARSLITLSTIVFGCVALVFTGGYFEDTFYKMRESYIQAHTGHIQIVRTGFFEKGALEPYEYLLENPAEIIEAAGKVPGVKFVTPRMQFSGLISTGENTIAFIGMGVDAKHEQSHPLREKGLRSATDTLTLGGVITAAGEPLDTADTYGVMLGRGLAENIGAKVGDGLILLTNTVNGSVNALDVNVKGIFYTSSKAYDDHFLRLPVATAQKLLHTETVQSLVVMLERTEDTERIKAQLAQVCAAKGFDVELKGWNEISDFYNQTVKLFNRFFLIMKIVVVIVVILSIYNTMNMAVMERIREIGTIMALGTKRRGVVRLFVLEGLILGMIGGAIGVVFGSGVTVVISKIGIPMPPPPGATMYWLSEPKVVPGMLLFAFVLSVATSLLSSLYPAYKASRLEVADALRK
jgi:putative ABC transport system permease protein